MKNEKNRKIAVSIIILFFSLFLLIFSSTSIYGVDKQGKEFYQDSLKKAVVAYASIRGINAVVSVIKESDLEVAPTGMGISLAVGQILDPIDDMVERVSDVLVVAIVALGVERVLMELGASLGFTAIGILLIPITALLWIKHKYSHKIMNFLIKLVIFILILRFFLPISSYLNTYINDVYLNGQILEGQKKLDLIKVDEKIGEFKVVEGESGFIKQISSTVQTVKIKTTELQEVFIKIKENSTALIEGMITIITVYILSFILQVILIPLGVYFGFHRLSRIFIQEK
ncbi:MAG: hypothetical protein OIF32_00900 [Campylobacterales bacterium]|nr:hypothetical protein [Campylobacterales bacterium]